MKKLFALLVVAGMVFVSCGTSNEEVNEEAVVTETEAVVEEAPVAVEEEAVVEEAAVEEAAATVAE